ncbi:MAG: DUF2284 domain-containing protein [Desulfosalsimonas sp.]
MECTREKLLPLLENAASLGATDAALIPAEKIRVEEGLAEKCTSPKCINYGLSKSCPPNVGGPAEMRRLLESYKWAVFFKIEVPSDVLYSGQGIELFQLLHETAAGVERCAIEAGFCRARAYAGNSCKKVFCPDHLECRALLQDGRCRNPDRARPSMSGFGINVTRLYEAAGWQVKGVTYENGSESIRMSSICGLILIC